MRVCPSVMNDTGCGTVGLDVKLLFGSLVFVVCVDF